MEGEERNRLQVTSTGDHQEKTMAKKAQEQFPSEMHEGNKNGEAENKKGDDENFFEVEAILKKRIYNGQLQYLVKWCNYPDDENTWEPYENVECVPDMLEAFEQGNSSPLYVHEEEEEGEQENNGTEGDMEVEVERMQKLDEDFYEVEAIRKKRKHKGQLQYLIKWRNYPEAKNTWEPYGNIKHCTEMLEAFEKSSQKHKRRVKIVLPKRKCSIQIKHDGDGATTHIRGEENPPLSPLLSKERARSSNSRPGLTDFLCQKPENSHDNKEKDVIKDKNGKEKTMDDEAISTNEIYVDLPKLQQEVEAMNKQEGTNFVMQDYVQKWREKEEAEGGVGAAAMSIFLPNYKEDIAGQGKDPSKLLPKGLVPFFHSEPEPEASKDGNQLTGAKKRKSGNVRRFVHPDKLVKQVMNINLEDSVEAIAETVSGSATTDANNKMAKEDLHITKILKPVQYYTPTSSPSSDSNQHVYISFMALRSDGTKVCVNNKELRAINPFLLIDFYEQHLRFTPDP